MLSRLLTAAAPSSAVVQGGPTLARCLGAAAFRRCFSSAQTAAAAVTKTEGKSTIQGTSYNVVKFKQEDVGEVVKEVPHFQFYYIGGEHKDNKYRDVPLDIPILTDVPAPQLKKPEMKFSVLENGMRIVSVDKQGLTANLGLFVHAGSRFETPAEEGLSHMVECVAFQHSGRWECLFPRLLPWEVNACHKEIKKAHERLKADTDQYVSELLHQTAYHNNTLGNALLANEGRALEHFTGDNIREYMMKHFSAERKRFYVAIPNLPREEPKPIYTGGYKLEENADMPVCNIAIDPPRRGGSFSTGGPGKGMHSRLYLNVLNQNPNVESCMAFNTQYSDSGLFGMYITGYGQEAPRLVDIALNELHKLNSFTPEEVSRAKNHVEGKYFYECRELEGVDGRHWQTDHHEWQGGYP
ncbi:Mitochondrial-processing peptidase subunit alpha [Perkinsus olseni]|uniref:Mitochondrial-processing peptidase subunit alpha n=1 Tax=Perkinsus olseni TaxID=32597 RepID=A0A7J6P278_PEROL|nr:Mitochondrial-processing peptidase subunit alpha [Perkinsus olseni]